MNEYFHEMLIIEDLEYLDEIKAKKVKMNDDFNEHTRTVKSRPSTRIKWQKVGLNGFFSEIPSCNGDEIWCSIDPRSSHLLVWQIVEKSGNIVLSHGHCKITDVLDAREQAEEIAKQWKQNTAEKKAV